ncbi:site-2 protease family protein [Roseimaritima sediminicola]|uniref:site-2 protease family protein n=1 Tax=Roseimaritima sediminicola TaxID=2662066 RepID=UPI00129838B5|nr:site-2 protease family protein [Roseimaritima sediminicola]
MLSRRLPLGTYFGIGLYVHWTFSLLLLAIAVERFNSGHGWPQVLAMLAVVLTMYFCVTLHEYGHALMARRFGVGTRDITLLPIGGVARLEQMPRVPWQELLIAVAGPAVNVVIAGVLAAVVIATSLLWDGFLQRAWRGMAELDSGGITGPGFLMVILISNVALVLFNMIPAFPMDGGRVLRSVLAMVVDYRRATWWASRIGLGCALLMASFAWINSFYVMLLIAGFVAWAGMVEAKQVNITESVRGLRVADAMIAMDSHSVPVSATDSLDELSQRWHGEPLRVLPVVDSGGFLVGVVHLRDAASAASEGGGDQLVASIVRQDLPTVHPDQEVESVLTQPPPGRVRQLPVVSYAGLFLGILDLDSLLERAALARQRAAAAAAPGQPPEPSDPLPATHRGDDGTLFST